MFVQIKDGVPVLKTDNLQDMIVHIADDMTYTPKVEADKKTEVKKSYLPIEERMEAAEFPKYYPWLYQKGFGFNENGEAKLVEDAKAKNLDLTNVRTYAEWQVWVAKEISKDFVSQYIPGVSAEEAEGYLKRCVNSTLK